MTIIKTHLILSGLACAIALGSALPASALAQGQPDDVQTRKVSFADLDLAKPAGMQTMMSRIHSAAVQVCGSPSYVRDLERSTAAYACIKAAQETAVISLAAIAGPQYARGLEAGVKVASVAPR